MVDATDELIMVNMFNDILYDEMDTGALSPKTANGDDICLIGFPELSELTEFEVIEYFELDNAPHYDPSEDKIVCESMPEQVSIGTKRRSELKRLQAYGWMREEVDKKRRRFTYKSPDKLTTVTSLKEAMKTISLAQVIDTADDDTVRETLQESLH